MLCSARVVQEILAPAVAAYQSQPTTRTGICRFDICSLLAESEGVSQGACSTIGRYCLFAFCFHWPASPCAIGTRYRVCKDPALRLATAAQISMLATPATYGHATICYMYIVDPVRRYLTGDESVCEREFDCYLPICLEPPRLRPFGYPPSRDIPLPSAGSPEWSVIDYL